MFVAVGFKLVRMMSLPPDAHGTANESQKGPAYAVRLFAPSKSMISILFGMTVTKCRDDGSQ